MCTVWVRDSSLKKFSFPTKAPGGAPTGALAHPSSSMVSACGFVNLCKLHRPIRDACTVSVQLAMHACSL